MGRIFVGPMEEHYPLIFRIPVENHLQINDNSGISIIFVSVIISTRLRWEGHVARMKDGRNAFKILRGTRK